jgi:hypothetical protein
MSAARALSDEIESTLGLLRPIVSFINRQPLTSTELETKYLVSVTCRSPDEAHVRALLLHGLAGCGLTLRRLDSSDLEGSARVVVTAFATTSQRVDAEIEKNRRQAQPRADGFGGKMASRSAVGAGAPAAVPIQPQRRPPWRRGRHGDNLTARAGECSSSYILVTMLHQRRFSAADQGRKEPPARGRCAKKV